jgi:hypothetical protein
MSVTILLDSMRRFLSRGQTTLSRAPEKTRGAISKWRLAPESSEKNFCFRLTRSRSFFNVYLSPVIPRRRRSKPQC